MPGQKGAVEKEVVITLETGMLLLHKHGNDCMLVGSIYVLYGSMFECSTNHLIA